MAAMLFIVAAAFAPLCAALATCTMPCCHPMTGLSPASGGENPCPARECTIAKAPEAAPAVAPQAPPSVATPTALVELAAAPAIVVHVLPDERGGPPHGGRALHLVHSVFLI